MTIHYRRRRISEVIRRYKPAAITDTVNRVLDTETSLLVEDAAYETLELAQTKCRMLAAADIENLYLPDRAATEARIAAIIGDQSDPQWAAKLIFELFEGSKA